VLVGADRSRVHRTPGEVVRVDAAHPRAPSTAVAEPADELGGKSPADGDGSPARVRAAGFLGALLGYLGVAGLAVGAGLLWYGHVESRPELEQPGWQAVMAGQIGLLVGWAALVWSGSRTSDRNLRRRVAELSDRLAALESSRSMNDTAAHSFYHHLAAGAPTHLLLADLKGQLDLLATRLASRHNDHP
jgi:hypothetical protein